MGSIPVGEELDAVFGQGEPLPDRRVGYYLYRSFTAPRSVAHEFSQDTNLYRKAWFLVLITAGIFVIYEYISEVIAVALGMTQPTEYMAWFLPVFFLLIIAGFLLFRAIWCWGFRYGDGFSDRGICAAVSLTQALYLVVYPFEAILAFATISSTPDFSIHDLFEKYEAVWLGFSLLTFIGINAFSAFYFADVLQIRLKKALGRTLLAASLWLFIWFVPLFVLISLPLYFLE